MVPKWSSYFVPQHKLFPEMVIVYVVLIQLEFSGDSHLIEVFSISTNPSKNQHKNMLFDFALSIPFTVDYSDGHAAMLLLFYALCSKIVCRY